MGRRWLPVVVLFVGGLLGVAVAGVPDRHKDPPLAVRTTSAPTSVTSVVETTTSSTAPPPPATRARGDVQVVTVNASGVSGAAARLSTRLESEGWKVGTPISRAVQDGSEVLHRPGLDAEARALASSLGVDASVVHSTESPPGDGDVAVIVGKDLAARL